MTAEERRAKEAAYHRAYNKAYYQAHKREINARHKARRAAHWEEYRGKQRARQSKYNSAHREEINAKRREYCQAHKCEINARRKARRLAQKAKRKAGTNDIYGCVDCFYFGAEYRGKFYCAYDKDRVYPMKEEPRTGCFMKDEAGRYKWFSIWGKPSEARR